MSTIAADNISNLAGTASTAMNNAINGSAKAWVNFNGSGTVAIRASFNVTSITDNGVGDYTVNFINAMPDANYCVTGIHDPVLNSDNVAGRSIQFIAFATNSLRFSTNSDGTGVKEDSAYVNVAVFR